MNRVSPLATLPGGCSRFLAAALVAGGLFAGCDQRQDVYSYDPKVDSLIPPGAAYTDTSILEEQKTRPRPAIPGAPAVATAPAAAAAPAAAPATAPAAPADGATPAPEAGGTSATPPAAPTAPETTPPPPPQP